MMTFDISLSKHAIHSLKIKTANATMQFSPFSRSLFRNLNYFAVSFPKSMNSIQEFSLRKLAFIVSIWDIRAFLRYALYRVSYPSSHHVDQIRITVKLIPYGLIQLTCTT